MITENNDKKNQLIEELGGQRETEPLLRVMEQLDHYKVDSPTSQETEDLIAFLKPVLREQTLPARQVLHTEVSAEPYLFSVIQLVEPQVMLLSKWFIVLSIVCMTMGLMLTNAFDGNTMKFLTNAAPILGILTVFYEFRAKLNGVSELEATCPYSQAQLATARLIVVLGYNSLLCLLATPVVSYWQGQVLWIVVVGWSAPLLLMLGIALAASIRLGIIGGCLVSMSVWALQFAIGRSGFLLSSLLHKQSTMVTEIISLVIGLALIFYSYKRWHLNEIFLRK